MGLLGAVGGFFSGLFGGSSKESTSYNYKYEPDRVRVAEIEREKAIRIAELQQENISKQKQAELELMQANANLELDIMKAKEEGFTNVISALTNMMKEWNILGEQRIAFMNNAKFEVSSKINNLYSDLIKNVDEDAFDFQLNKQPQLFEQLEKFQGTDSYESYKNNIDKFIGSFINEKSDMVKSYRKQQEILMLSSLKSIDVINSEVTQIVMNRVESLTKTIQGDNDLKQLSNQNNEIENFLENENQKVLDNSE